MGIKKKKESKKQIRNNKKDKLNTPQISVKTIKKKQTISKEFQDKEREKSKIGRIVPWKDWYEWKEVYKKLYSSIVEENYEGIQKVMAWKVRGRLPISIESTANLIQILLSESKHGKVDSDPQSRLAFQLEYGMTVIRFVNGIVDRLQKSSRAISIRDIASNISLPHTFVTIRHELSHNRFPSLPVLRAATKQALFWLESNYWEPQNSLINKKENESETYLKCLIPLFKEEETLEISEMEEFNSNIKNEYPFIINRLIPSILDLLLCESLTTSLKGPKLKKISKIFKYFEYHSFPLFRYHFLVHLYENFLKNYKYPSNNSTKFNEYLDSLELFTFLWPDLHFQTINPRTRVFSQLFPFYSDLKIREILNKFLPITIVCPKKRDQIDFVFNHASEIERLTKYLSHGSSQKKEVKGGDDNDNDYQNESKWIEHTNSVKKLIDEGIKKIEYEKETINKKSNKLPNWTLVSDWPIGTPISFLPNGKF